VFVRDGSSKSVHRRDRFGEVTNQGEAGSHMGRFTRQLGETIALTEFGPALISVAILTEGARAESIVEKLVYEGAAPIERGNSGRIWKKHDKFKQRRQRDRRLGNAKTNREQNKPDRWIEGSGDPVDAAEPATSGQVVDTKG
jgi:hypothetical protein